MKKLTKDTRVFINCISDYIGRGRDTGNTTKIQHLLSKVSDAAIEAENAKIESAIALSDEQKHALYTNLSKALDRELTITYEVKPSLLGGMRIEIGNLVLDMSFISQLNQIADAIL